mmetsp:Transcript_9127/g.37635  ORF Transcript_9127/g.37635 Transcript_9127/m.37635 type:complete len:154 (+) Transcript_9127:34-495(+)|eukprot:CAMPEP_0114621514 /NCGR_PEP_ID=MMETSP0168-20121206/9267_1 /TAXON_ID=95228 ORGANISM="Vannella sp., Strain DIVA3 517/6/12" /NCGR_SAMPLE_ID=MMETSP0168 /ASSEMBLY_ACC=CAM_ASM_000044 /LENGTH=153 /DNA_ID=CAMNT_0001832713 /DNA_START=24 /DNA_END=485 /DNA_ORIENTATION=-
MAMDSSLPVAPQGYAAPPQNGSYGAPQQPPPQAYASYGAEPYGQQPGFAQQQPQFSPAPSYSDAGAFEPSPYPATTGRLTEPKDDVLVVVQVALLFLGVICCLPWLGGFCFVGHKNQGVKVLARINAGLFLLCFGVCFFGISFWLLIAVLSSL